MAAPRSKNPIIALLVALAGLAVAVFVGTQGGGDDQAPAAASVTSVTSVTSSATTTTPKAATAKPTAPKPGATSSVAKNSAVPDYVWTTLAAIDAGGWPPADSPGTQGGRTFGNHEGRLPATSDGGRKVRYQEWDVNRKRDGRGRDAERIVTGDDGSAWYTSDHYETFVRMR
ncbi:ribonuclease domain-containing protein [Prescottella defluvii]|uniref:ribonuclease domain-containing protein n=1 Tax=Prescottella defluvii TaxID=1323361 RepID=UPI0004F370D8|nr:ribonuclease domain-containing protein [Prescottella defluvii]